jgi:iron(III) transport system ATP-binding protein
MNRPIAAEKLQANSASLEIHSVSRCFGEVTALDNISLAVRNGEIICLVGESGCGKSTLLRIIAGVDAPDEGRLTLEGEEIAGLSAYVEPENRNIGMMFQDYALFPHLDVASNILFGLKKIPHAEARRRCDEIIERIGIGHLARRFPHMLSGGEQQRVALARALAPQPKILLMDEPFSNLDSQLRDSVRDETLALLRELGTTAILVTHDPEEALSAGNRVVLMRNGRVVQEGSGAEVYDRPCCAYAAEFFCSFNKVPGVCRSGFVDTPLGRFAAPHFAEGAAVTLYVRPQSIRIAGSGGIAAEVVERELLGEIEQMKIRLPSLSEPLRMRSTQRNKLSPGEKIFVSVDPEAVLVF